jgi:hypothetical protein
MHVYLTPAGLRALRRIVLAQQDREPPGPLRNQSMVIDSILRTFITASRTVEESAEPDIEGIFGSAFGTLWRTMHGDTPPHSPE